MRMRMKDLIAPAVLAVLVVVGVRTHLLDPAYLAGALPALAAVVVAQSRWGRAVGRRLLRTWNRWPRPTGPFMRPPAGLGMDHRGDTPD